MLLELKPFSFPRQCLINVEEGDAENSGEFSLLQLLCCDPLGLGHSLLMTLAKASSRSLQVDVADSP